MNRLRSQLEQNLGWVVLLVLLAGCLIVLRPFVSALLWAVVLCVSSWPVYRRLLAWSGNRSALAVPGDDAGHGPHRPAALCRRGYHARRQRQSTHRRHKTLDCKRSARPARMAGQGAGGRTTGDGLLAKHGGGHLEALDGSPTHHRTGECMAAQGWPGAGRRPDPAGLEHFHRVLPVPRWHCRRRTFDHGD